MHCQNFKNDPFYNEKAIVFNVKYKVANFAKKNQVLLQEFYFKLLDPTSFYYHQANFIIIFFQIKNMNVNPILSLF